MGLFNSLWGVILPTVATPTGVFLLRQYMLTIPDELIDAARMDKASEWQIYWRIVLPLERAGAGGAGDLLGGLALERLPMATDRPVAQGALHAAGRPQHLCRQLNVQWHYILAMTVVTMIPVVLVFVFLQRFITTGIASAGIK